MFTYSPNNFVMLMLPSSMALLSHLAETCKPSSLEAHADDIHMRALLMQTCLDNTGAALTHLNGLVRSKLPVSDGDEESSYFAQRLDSLATQTRSAKVVAGKIVRSLEELISSSLTLE